MKKTFELLLLILFQKSKNIFKFKSLKVKRAKLDTLNFFIFSNSNIKQLLTLSQQLFDYQYPFKYPDLFKTESIKFNKDQYLVRFEFIRVFSHRSATKHFYLRQFFQQHSVSNKRIRDMKQIFIQLTQEFYQFGLIDSKVKLILHNNYIDIED